jgi:hypothetical protein
VQLFVTNFLFLPEKEGQDGAGRALPQTRGGPPQEINFHLTGFPGTTWSKQPLALAWLPTVTLLMPTLYLCVPFSVEQRLLKPRSQPGMVETSNNPSTGEAEAGES